MSIQFPYQFIPGADGLTPRPVIYIRMGLDELSAKHGFLALIDSGADFCIFSSRVASRIGIADITTGKKASAVGAIAGAKSDYYMHRVVIKIAGQPCTMDVAFMPSFTDLGYGILGQKGFFENFVVKFDLKKSEIELKRHNS